MQPWRTCSPAGFAAGGVAAGDFCPEEGVVVVVVVVVLDVGTVLGGAVVVVVVLDVGTVLGGRVVGTVVVVVVVLVVEVVVLGATVVVVVDAVVDVVVVEALGVGPDRLIPVGLGAAAGGVPGAATVIIAVVHAPAFCRVATSSTRRASARVSVALSDASVTVAWVTALDAPSRWESEAFSVACAARSAASSSDPTMFSYWLASTPFVFSGPNGLGPARFMNDIAA
jgi:hypothetical protein